MRKPTRDMLSTLIQAAFVLSSFIVIIYKAYTIVPIIRANGFVDSFLAFQWINPLYLVLHIFIPTVLLTIPLSLLLVLVAMLVSLSESKSKK